MIVAIHNGCIGAGVDLISAADIRYCTQDAWFQVKVCFCWIFASQIMCSKSLPLLAGIFLRTWNLIRILKVFLNVKSYIFFVSFSQVHEMGRLTYQKDTQSKV